MGDWKVDPALEGIFQEEGERWGKLGESRECVGARGLPEGTAGLRALKERCGRRARAGWRGAETLAEPSELASNKRPPEKLPRGCEKRNPSAPLALMVFHQFFRVGKLVPSPKSIWVFAASRGAVLMTSATSGTKTCAELQTVALTCLLWKRLPAPVWEEDYSCFLSLTNDFVLCCCRPVNLLHVHPLCGFFRLKFCRLFAGNIKHWHSLCIWC